MGYLRLGMVLVSPDESDSRFKLTCLGTFTGELNLQKSRVTDEI